MFYVSPANVYRICYVGLDIWTTLKDYIFQMITCYWLTYFFWGREGGEEWSRVNSLGVYASGVSYPLLFFEQVCPFVLFLFYFTLDFISYRFLVSYILFNYNHFNSMTVFSLCFYSIYYNVINLYSTYTGNSSIICKYAFHFILHTTLMKN